MDYDISLGQRIENSANYLTKRFKYLVGFPDEVDSDLFAGEKITLMEESARGLLITRRGYDQLRTDYEYPDYNWKNNFGRWVVIITGIRTAILAFYPTFYPDSGKNDLMDIYLGNPFHGKSYSVTVATLAFSMVVVCAVLREYAIYVEDDGTILDLQYLRIIQYQGFDVKQLEISSNRIQSFKKFLIFHVTNWTRMLRFNKMFNPMLLASFRLIDPLLYSNPIYTLTSIFWVTMETITSYFSFTSLLNVGGHTILLCQLYLYRLRTCQDLATEIVSRKQINDSSLKKISYRMLNFLNCFEKVMDGAKYLFFIFIFLISLLADSFIFLAITSHFPPLTLGFFYFGGFFCITVIGIVIYFAGEIVERSEEVYKHLVKIIYKCPFAIQEKLYAQKVLDRIGIYGTGGKIGDVIDSITRDMFVYYMLENASTVMLLICSINATT